MLTGEPSASRAGMDMSCLFCLENRISRPPLVLGSQSPVSKEVSNGGGADRQKLNSNFHFMQLVLRVLDRRVHDAGIIKPR